MNKCPSCDAEFQHNDPDQPGYIPQNIELNKNSICQRCFRLKHYNDLKKVKTKSTKEINKNQKVIFVTDPITFNPDLIPNNQTILVLNKYDLIEKQVNINKLKDKIKSMVKENVIDIIFISAKKNKNISTLINKIISLKQKEVYILGYASSGKTTIINEILKNYNINQELATGYQPGVTINENKIKINKSLTIIDTPGIESDAISDLPKDIIKKIYLAKKIKPITFQLKPNQSLVIEDIIKIDYLNGDSKSFTLFLPENIKYHRQKLEKEHLLDKKQQNRITLTNEDLTFQGIGFLKVKGNAEIAIKTKEGIITKKRPILI